MRRMVIVQKHREIPHVASEPDISTNTTRNPARRQRKISSGNDFYLRMTLFISLLTTLVLIANWPWLMDQFEWVKNEWEDLLRCFDWGAGNSDNIIK